MHPEIVLNWLIAQIPAVRERDGLESEKELIVFPFAEQPEMEE